MNKNICDVFNLNVFIENVEEGKPAIVIELSYSLPEKETLIPEEERCAMAVIMDEPFGKQWGVYVSQSKCRTVKKSFFLDGVILKNEFEEDLQSAINDKIAKIEEEVSAMLAVRLLLKNFKKRFHFDPESKMIKMDPIPDPPSAFGSAPESVYDPSVPARPLVDAGATHHLKTWPEFFKAVKTGVKTSELRKRDRDFRVGDFLSLEEWEDDSYTGAKIKAQITHILEGFDGLEKGYCILSFDKKETVFTIPNPPEDQQPEFHLDPTPIGREVAHSAYLPEFLFQDVWERNLKVVKIRNDGPYAIGDMLDIKEAIGEKEPFPVCTGRIIHARITNAEFESSNHPGIRPSTVDLSFSIESFELGKGFLDRSLDSRQRHDIPLLAWQFNEIWEGKSMSFSVCQERPIAAGDFLNIEERVRKGEEPEDNHPTGRKMEAQVLKVSDIAVDPRSGFYVLGLEVRVIAHSDHS